MVLSLIVTALMAMQPAFEVASVKPSAPRTPGQMPRPSKLEISPGRMSAKDVSLQSLIVQAYDVLPSQVSGGPEWVSTQRFDFEAKTAGEHPRGDILAMLQQLLADRFKLQINRQQREMQVSALVLGKNRQFKPTTASQDAESSVRVRIVGRSQMQLTAVKASMPLIANYLAGRLRRIVVDRTGLSGEFDFDVRVLVDHVEASDPAIPEPEVVAHLFESAVEKLGLRIETRKEAVEILAIIHAEMPDAN